MAWLVMRRSPGRRLGAGVLLLACSLRSGSAAAQILGPGEWAIVGLNTGRSAQAGSSGALGGGVASYGVMGENMQWWALQFDALYDASLSATRLCIGPELGYFWPFPGFERKPGGARPWLWLAVGANVGYVLELGRDKAGHGLAVRPSVTLGPLSPYARLGWRSGVEAGPYAEYGVLIRYPFEMPDLLVQ